MWVYVRVRYDDCDADRDNAFSPSSNLHQEDEEVMRGPWFSSKANNSENRFEKSANSGTYALTSQCEVA